MHTLRYNYRLSTLSISEHRLIHKTQAASVLERDAITILHKEETTDQQLDDLSRKFETGKEEDILTKVESSLNSFGPIEQRIIQLNITRLRARINVQSQSADKKRELQQKTAQLRKEVLDAKANSIPMTQAEIDAATLKAAEAKSPGEQIGDVSTGIAETIFGKEGTKNWSPEKKRRVGLYISGGTAVVAGLALWAWVRARRAARDGKDAAKNAKGSLWKKLLIGAGVGAAVFVGIKFLRGDYTLDKLKNGAKDMAENAKDAVNDMTHPWLKYGLEEEPYKKAIDIYKVQREDGVEEIEKIFQVKPGEANPKYEAFMKEMREKYTTYEVNGIHYARVDIALYNYEKGLEDAVAEMIQWMNDHKTEILLAGLVVAQFNSLKTILTTGAAAGKGIIETALKFSTAVGSFGVKSLVKHPIMSLLALGGSIYALKEAKENIYLPESLSELSRVATLSADTTGNKKNKPQIILGKTKNIQTEQINLQIQEQAVNLGAIGTNYPAWAKAKVSDFLGTLFKELPNIIGLTNGEVVANRTTEGINTLQRALESGKTHALTSTEAIKSGMPGKYTRALEQLEKFRAAYLLHRCSTVTTSDEPVIQFELLRTALQDVGIEIGLVNNLMNWKDENMEKAFDLCVDPSITDENKIYEASDGMRQNESDISYFGTHIFEHLRQLQQQALEKGESLPWMQKSGIVGMAIGNFMYCFEFNPKTFFIDTENLMNYVYKVPLQAGADLLNPDKAWADVATTFGRGIVTSMAFSVGMAPLIAIKRIAIGGGPMVPHVGRYVKHTKGIAKVVETVGKVFRHLPGVSQALYFPQALGAYGDFATVGRLKWLPGRFVNEMCRKGGIRPEWALALEKAYAAGNTARMNTVSGKLGRGFFDPDTMTIDDFYKQIRRHFAERLEQVNMKEWNLANGGTRLTQGTGVINGEDAYEWILGKKPIPGISGAPGSGASTSIIPDNLELKVPAGTAVPPPPTAPSPTPKLSSSPSAAEWKEMLKGKNLNNLQIDEFMDQIKQTTDIPVDRSTLALIRDSEGAKQIFAGAVASNDVAEFRRALNAARSAAQLRAGMNIVGAAGDVFGIIMAYADWHENGRKILETTNVALKELYSSAQTMNLVEGGTSAASLVIGGYVFTSSLYAGEGVLAAAGVAGTTVMLPVSMLVLGGMYYGKQLQSVTEGWLNEEADWAKKEPGTLLSEMEKMGPGKQQRAADATRGEYWARWASTNPEEFKKWEKEWANPEGSDTKEKANEGARYQITRAYVAKMTRLTQRNGETDQDFQKRFNEFQRRQILYIGNITQGKFDSSLTLVYKDAHAHAELMSISEELESTKQSRILNIKMTNDAKEQITVPFNLEDYRLFQDKKYVHPEGITQGNVIHAYEQEKMTMNTIQLKILKQMKLKEGQSTLDSQNKIIQNTLLTEIRYTVALAEKNILSADFGSLEFTGDAEQDRLYCRYVLSMGLRSMLHAESAKLQQQKTVSNADMELAILRLKKFLTQDPAALREAANNPAYYTRAQEFKGNSQQLTNDQWIRANLFIDTPPDVTDATIDASVKANTEALKKAGDSADIVYIPGKIYMDTKSKEYVREQSFFQTTIEGKKVRIPLPTEGEFGLEKWIVPNNKSEAKHVPEKNEQFRFSATVDGKEYNYSLKMQDLFLNTKNNLTEREKYMAYAAITKPFDLTGHPKADNKEFVRRVRRYEIERILNTVTYERTNYLGWNAGDYRKNMETELLQPYVDTDNKEAFLKKLVDALVNEGGVIGESGYYRVLSKVLPQQESSTITSYESGGF